MTVVEKNQKKLKTRFDKSSNDAILNITPQIAAKANGGVEIKKFEKKFKIKFDKCQTCAKLNNTLQFAMRMKAIVNKTAAISSGCLKIE